MLSGRQVPIDCDRYSRNLRAVILNGCGSVCVFQSCEQLVHSVIIICFYWSPTGISHIHPELTLIYRHQY